MGTESLGMENRFQEGGIMPDRVIKSSVRTSPNLNRLSDAGEVLFYRILTLCDDHGGFEASPDYLRGELFSKKMTQWPIRKLINELVNLTNNDLIRLWVQNERLFGFVINLHKHQRIRSLHQRKSPPAPEKFDIRAVNRFLGSFAVNCQRVAVNCQQLPADCCQLQQIVSRTPNPNPNLNPNLNLKHKPKHQQTTNIKVPEKKESSENEKTVEVLKLAFLKKFQSNPFPYFSNDQHREKQFEELNQILLHLVDRVKGNIDIFLSDMDGVAKNNDHDVGTLLYFIKSKHGASRWEKMADEFTFTEHARLKQEWIDALDANKRMRQLAENLKARDQPDWVQNAINELNIMVQKYERETRPAEKDMLKNQIFTMQKRFGFG